MSASTTTRLRRRSAALIILVTLALVAGIVVSALAAEGRSVSRTTANDGGAWLVNRDLGVVGHKNRAAGELSTVLRVIDSSAVNVHQAESITVVHDPVSNQLFEIDVRTLGEDLQPTELPPGTQVLAIDESVLVYRVQPFAMWQLDSQVLPTLKNLDGVRPTVESDGAGHIAATSDGLVAVANPDRDEFRWVRIGASVELTEDGLATPASTHAIEFADPILDMTVVGTTAVVLDTTGRLTLIEATGASETLNPDPGIADDPIVVLQQPTVVDAPSLRQPATQIVAMTRAGRIITIDRPASLGSGPTVTVTAEIPGRNPLRPIVHQGCIYAVVTEPPTFAGYCDELTMRPLDGAGQDLQLRVVNGWVWVNDLSDGGTWVTGDDLELQVIDDWGLAAERLNEDEEQADGEQAEDQSFDTNLVEDPDALADVHGDDIYDPTRPNEPPVAVDDSARTRGDRTIIVPVLDNDTDVNNDILAVVGVEVERGEVVAVITPDRSGVQVEPRPGFSGEAVLRYLVSDGRSAPVPAAVFITIVARLDDNVAPVATTDVIATAPGTATTVDVLRNDFDPDGDTVALVGATTETGTLRWSPTGQVTFTPDTTTESGWIDITYTIVDDLGATGEGRLRVEIRDAGANQEPDARNDHAVTVVGRPVLINLLANDSDPDGDRLQIGSRPKLLLPEDARPNTTTSADGEFVFSADEAGTYLFTYTVTDSAAGGSERDTAQIRVDVLPDTTNSPPLAIRDDIVIPVGQTRIVYVLENDGDPDGDIVNIVDWQSASGLILEEFFDASGHSGFYVTVVPGAPDRPTFMYSISDGINDPVSAPVVVAAVDAVPQDQPPIAVDDVVEARAGSLIDDIDVLANDFDPEGGPLRVVGVNAPDDVEATIAAGGATISLEVASGVNSSFNISYDIEDQTGNRAAAIVRVQLIDASSPNRPPIARADVARTRRGEPVAIPVLDNDSDPDADPIAIEGIATQPDHGQARIDPVRNLVEYYPDPDYTGTDLFSYAIVDALGERAIGEVFIGIADRDGVNQPPIANDDAYALGPGSTATPLAVLDNDFDPESDPIRVVAVTAASVGHVDVDDFGRVRFAPPETLAEETTAVFTYTIADTAGNRATATVAVTLPAYAPEPEPTPTPTPTLAIPVAPTPEPTPAAESTPTPEPTVEATATPTPSPSPTPTAEPNEPPVAEDDEIGPVSEGDEFRIPVLDNDFDPDGPPGQLNIVSVGNDWTVVGRSVVGIAGAQTEQTTYVIEDGEGGQATGQITVIVAENQAPTVEPLEVTTAYETAIRIDVSDLAQDSDGDELFFVCCQSIRGGAIQDVASGPGALEMTFVPDDGFFGTAGFSYIVDDQNGHQISGAVSVVVDPPDNRPPVVVDNTVIVAQGTSQAVDLDQLTEDPDDADVVEWSLAGVTGAGFSVEIAGSIATVSVPRDTEPGRVGSFDFTADDGSLTATGTVTVEVSEGENRPPVAADTSVELPAAGSTTVDLAGLVDDPDRGDTVTYTVGAGSGGVEATLVGTLVRIEAAADATLGEVAISYEATDSRGASDSATIAVTVVEPEAPPPSAVDDAATTSPGLAIEVSVLDNDVDPLGLGLTVISAASPVGTTTVLGGGSRVQFHPEDFVGATTVTYTMRDEAGREATGTIAIETIGVPDQPAPPQVRADSGEVTVSWTAPRANGRAITGYEITSSEGGTQSVGVQNSYTWVGLTNGVSYTFTVTALNELGASPPSEPSRAATPDTVPEAPAAPSVDFADRALVVSWEEPVNHGSPIEGYELEIGGEASAVQSVGTDRSFTWTGLTNGDEYTFVVRAINGAGPGPFSPPSTSEHPETTPDAPTIETVQRANLSGSLDISWSRPEDGGGAIIEYRIVSDSAGTALVAGANTTTYSWSDLPNGQPAQFQVQARNRSGWGPLSSLSAPVVPCGPPDRPSAPSVTRGDQFVDISFAAPADNGCGITGFEITDSSGTVQNTTTTNHRFASLTNGTSYTFTVRATNEMGSSLASPDSAAVIPAGPPICGSAAITAQPTAPGQLSIDWTAVIDNGAPIIGYELIGLGVSGVGADGNLKHSATGLADGTSYTIGLRASNDVGTSPTCDQTTATTWDLPTPVNASMVFEPEYQRLVATISGGTSTDPPIAFHRYGFTIDESVVRIDNLGAPRSVLTHDVTAAGDYAFWIRICNAVGCVETPPDCCLVSIQPPEQMDPPTITVQTVTDGHPSEFFGIHTFASWSAPNDNGSPIIDYEWEARYMGASNNWHQASINSPTTTTSDHALASWPGYTTFTDAGVLTFEARVRARNDLGTGPWSDWGSLTPPFLTPRVEISNAPDTEPCESGTISPPSSGQCPLIHISAWGFAESQYRIEYNGHISGVCYDIANLSFWPNSFGTGYFWNPIFGCSSEYAAGASGVQVEIHGIRSNWLTPSGN